jgi:hypothetical protein
MPRDSRSNVNNSRLKLQNQIAPHPQELASLQTVKAFLDDCRSLLAQPAPIPAEALRGEPLTLNEDGLKTRPLCYWDDMRERMLLAPLQTVEELQTDCDSLFPQSALARLSIKYGRLAQPAPIPAEALRGEPLTLNEDGLKTRPLCYWDELMNGKLRLMKAPNNPYSMPRDSRSNVNNSR